MISPLHVAGERLDTLLLESMVSPLLLASEFRFLPFPLSLLVLDPPDLDSGRPRLECFKDSIDQGFDPLRFTVTERLPEAVISIVPLVQDYPKSPIRCVVKLG